MQFLMLMIPHVYRDNKSDPDFIEELGKTVKILSLNGLRPLNAGARVSFEKGKPIVTDGPFIETKEELVKWAQRCPAEEGDVIEIRQIFEEADFAMKK